MMVGDGVTPLAGVWIEMYKTVVQKDVNKSHPSRVCGLKLKKSPKLATR